MLPVVVDVVAKTTLFFRLSAFVSTTSLHIAKRFIRRKFGCHHTSERASMSSERLLACLSAPDRRCSHWVCHLDTPDTSQQLTAQQQTQPRKSQQQQQGRRLCHASPRRKSAELSSQYLTKERTKKAWTTL
jgi:hypothetical protein